MYPTWGEKLVCVCWSQLGVGVGARGDQLWPDQPVPVLSQSSLVTAVNQLRLRYNWQWNNICDRTILSIYQVTISQTCSPSWCNARNLPWNFIGGCPTWGKDFIIGNCCIIFSRDCDLTTSVFHSFISVQNPNSSTFLMNELSSSINFPSQLTFLVWQSTFYIFSSTYRDF